MAAETARAFEALEAQAARLMSVFIEAGYDAVAPAIIQPADVFLDVVGEALRARTYVFNDLDGTELCLRPDLTVPACRLYLERHPEARTPARYCYNGPAFRFQPAGASAAHPREFRQAGIESFGGTDEAAGDVEVLRLTIKALRAAGLGPFRLRIGDVRLFDALLDAVRLPQRWQQRLHASFWRRDAFRAELQRLQAPALAALEGVPEALAGVLDPDDPSGAEQTVARWLEEHRIELVGQRSIAEITLGLLAAVADVRAEPLRPDIAATFASYLEVAGPAHEVADRIDAVTRGRGFDISTALSAFRHRLALCRDAGIPIDDAEFSADFGRNFEYYTGFVFEVLSPRLDKGSPVAGGGRYDRLLRAIGAPVEVPAVGAMIHTERLLSVADGGGA